MRNIKKPLKQAFGTGETTGPLWHVLLSISFKAAYMQTRMMLGRLFPSVLVDIQGAR